MILKHAWHLAKRFTTSLSLAPPAGPDEAWARKHMLVGERLIWDRMSNPDRRHAVAVARAVVDELGSDVDREVVAAALLHDSGKAISDLSTVSRVGATLFWAVADDDVARRWAEVDHNGPRKRLAQYRLHPELGAELLDEAGADALTSAWAREHHLSKLDWTVPVEVATVLKACDDD